jgi:hypothetical protein
MSSEGNEMMKKFIQKVVGIVLKEKDFNMIDSVEIFFVFGSKHKTAMCDWVYGMKIFTQAPMTWRSDIAVHFQMKIKRYIEKYLDTSVCCTDIIFVKDYE